MASLTKHGVPHRDSNVHRIANKKPPEVPLIRHLQRQLANAFVLFGNYKHYHWKTYPPLFRDLHVLFDEFAKETLVNIDRLAERIHLLGSDVPEHLIKTADVANVAVAPPHATMRDMVEEADRNVLVMVKGLRDAARIAGEHDDRATAALVSRVVEVYEQHQWWLRDILTKREGPRLS
jgi:starvation-inducible DNA-binding protein